MRSFRVVVLQDIRGHLAELGIVARFASDVDCAACLRSFAGGDAASEKVEQRGFASAGWPYHGKHLAGLDLAAAVAQDGLSAGVRGLNDILGLLCGLEGNGEVEIAPHHVHWGDLGAGGALRGIVCMRHFFCAGEVRNVVTFMNGLQREIEGSLLALEGVKLASARKDALTFGSCVSIGRSIVVKRWEGVTKTPSRWRKGFLKKP